MTTPFIMPVWAGTSHNATNVVAIRINIRSFTSPHGADAWNLRTLFHSLVFAEISRLYEEANIAQTLFIARLTLLKYRCYHMYHLL
jgi:hypothetical protein